MFCKNNDVIDYAKYKKGFIDHFLRGVAGVDYDAVFYFIEQYDFDSSNEGSLGAVADLVYKKATRGTAHPYTPTDLAGYEGLYAYKKGDEPHDSVRDNVFRREKAEQMSSEKGLIYVPMSDNFLSRVRFTAIGLKTPREERRAKRISIYDDLIRGWEESPIYLQIFYVYLGFRVVFSLISIF